MKRKILQGLLLVGLCCVPFFVVTGCGASNTLMCKNCGDDSDRLICYASGTTDDGVEYQSCVGPAGIIGCGINSKCFPTECMYVRVNEGDSDTMTNEYTSGCIKYYNGFGCIGSTEKKSYGVYSSGTSCWGCSCENSAYYENNMGDETTGYTQGSCLGFRCGDEKKIDSKDYNAIWVRQFTNGCWSCEAPEQNSSSDSD